MILTWEAVKSRPAGPASGRRAEPMPSGRTPLKRPQRSRVTPAAVDRIDEENAGCVTARVMCPTGNNPEDS